MQAVRQQILQLLTPVTMNHTIVFLASLADVWYQRRRREGSGSKVTRGVPVASEEQIIVVDIVYAIKVERASAIAWCLCDWYWSYTPFTLIGIYLKTVPFALKAHQTFSVRSIVFAVHTKTFPRPSPGNANIALITVGTFAFSKRFVFAINSKNTKPALSTLERIFEELQNSILVRTEGQRNPFVHIRGLAKRDCETQRFSENKFKPDFMEKKIEDQSCGV